jgi:hypothetical protein
LSSDAAAELGAVFCCAARSAEAAAKSRATRANREIWGFGVMGSEHTFRYLDAGSRGGLIASRYECHTDKLGEVDAIATLFPARRSPRRQFMGARVLWPARRNNCLTEIRHARTRGIRPRNAMDRTLAFAVQFPSPSSRIESEPVTYCIRSSTVREIHQYLITRFQWIARPS